MTSHLPAVSVALDRTLLVLNEHLVKLYDALLAPIKDEDYMNVLARKSNHSPQTTYRVI